MHTQPIGFFRNHNLALLLVAIFISHLIIAALWPLLDPSESRYALVAKLMSESNDYVLPQIISPHGKVEPFLAKPPLFFWLNSFYYEAFGFSNFTSRLPSILVTALTLLVTFVTVKSYCDRQTAMRSVIILSSMGLFYGFSRACQIDMLLTFFYFSASLILFTLLQIKTPSHLEKTLSALLGLFTGLGFLTKGPLIAALLMMILGLWFFIRSDYSVLRRIHWPLLSLTAGLIIIPWFTLLELRFHGAVKYFILQENLGRFLNSQYGDRYGTGHPHWYGTIWLYALIASLPWGLIAGIKLIQSMPKWGSVLPLHLLQQLRAQPPFITFCVICAIVPLCFFTFSRNILIAYVLPGIPALAVLLALSLEHLSRRQFFYFASSSVSALLIFSLLALPHLNSAASLETAMLRIHEYAAKNSPGGRIELNFPFGSPASVHLQNSYVLESSFDEIISETVASHPEYVLVKQRDQQKLKAMLDTKDRKYTERLLPLFSEGKWSVYQRIWQ